MKVDKRKRSTSEIRVMVALAGLVLLAIGVLTSLLLGLIGSLLIAGATAGPFEESSRRLRRGLVLLVVFIVSGSIAYLGLGWNETWKRSCIPSGDCQARHRFNILEQLDHKLFGLYSSPRENPNSYPSDALD
jgi:hypothetical protein